MSYKDCNTLYHYTSLSGFWGIVGSKGIWVNGIRYQQKGPTEFKFPLDFSIQVIEEELEKATGDQRKYLDECKATLTEIEKRSENQDNVENVTVLCSEGKPVRVVRSFDIVKSPIYICSFSPEGDLKSLWEKYGGKGTGVALGFDLAHLRSIFSPDRFEQCIYEPSRQRERVIDILRDNEPKAAQFKVDFLIKLVPFLKQGDEDDKEWRLIFDELAGVVGYQNIPSPTHSFRGKLPQTPYVEIPLADEGDKHPLREIIIGSASNKLSIEFVRECLRVNDISDCDIRRSVVSWPISSE